MKKDAKNFLTTENSSLIGEGKKALTSNFHQNNQLISPIKKGTYRGLFFHNLLASEAIWIGSGCKNVNGPRSLFQAGESQGEARKPSFF